MFRYSLRSLFIVVMAAGIVSWTLVAVGQTAAFIALLAWCVAASLMPHLLDARKRAVTLETCAAALLGVFASDGGTLTGFSLCAVLVDAAASVGLALPVACAVVMVSGFLTVRSVLTRVIGAASASPRLAAAGITAIFVPPNCLFIATVVWCCRHELPWLHHRDLVELGLLNTASIAANALILFLVLRRVLKRDGHAASLYARLLLLADLCALVLWAWPVEGF